MKKFIALMLALAVIFGLAACTGPSADIEKRNEQNDSVVVKNSLETKNLKEKLRRDEESAGKIGYVYLLTYGKFMGYYTITGKVSSNGSQLAPEQDVLDACNSDVCPVVVDGPQDDNTFGSGDPGIFFFTTEGTMVVTSLDYLFSDQPIATQVPLLNILPAK